MTAASSRPDRPEHERAILFGVIIDISAVSDRARAEVLDLLARRPSGEARTAPASR